MAKLNLKVYVSWGYLPLKKMIDPTRMIRCSDKTCIIASLDEAFHVASYLCLHAFRAGHLEQVSCFGHWRPYGSANAPEFSE